MKHIVIIACLLLLSKVTFGKKDSTFKKVYQLFQRSCTQSGCHNHNSPAANLDLQGTGNDPLTEVYFGLIGNDPQNQTAKNRGDKLVYPGDPYRSLLFRKVNVGLDKGSKLNDDGSEGKSMPIANPLTPKEQELIRQWIVYGAKPGLDDVPHALMNRYYDEGGEDLMPNPPPKPQNGYQIHTGPIFMPPNTEPGYEGTFFFKYELNNTDSIDVNKLQSAIKFGPTHHYAILRLSEKPERFAPGFRPLSQAAHTGFEYISLFNTSYTDTLPEGTAYRWPKNTVLDINPHFINYSPNKVMMAHTYLNVHTIPSYSAKIVMFYRAIFDASPQYALNILPDNQLRTTRVPISGKNHIGADGKIYVWQLSCHTHKLGKGFRIYKQNIDGTNGDLLYDGAHLKGDPALPEIGYDWEHPAVRRIIPFEEVDARLGFVLEADFQNNGTRVVNWGNSADDEMMEGLIQYTLKPYSGKTARLVQPANNQIGLYPNPAQDMVYITSDSPLIHPQLKLIDIAGRVVIEKPLEPQVFAGHEGTVFSFRREDLPAGLYFYQITAANHPLVTGKVQLK